MAAVVLGRWFLVDSFVRNFDSFATRFNFGREPMIEEMWKEFGFPNELPVPMNSCEQNERDTLQILTENAILQCYLRSYPSIVLIRMMV
jgi:hypothetical protein